LAAPRRDGLMRCFLGLMALCVGCGARSSLLVPGPGGDGGSDTAGSEVSSSPSASAGTAGAGGGGGAPPTVRGNGVAPTGEIAVPFWVPDSMGVPLLTYASKDGTLVGAGAQNANGQVGFGLSRLQPAWGPDFATSVETATFGSLSRFHVLSRGR